jgi:glycosyltransferase 2 family protein
LSRRRGLAGALVRLVGPALLVLVIARTPDRGVIVRALAGANPWLLALATALNAPNLYLKVVRWQAMLRVRGFRYGTGRAHVAYLTSLYLGLLTPGRVGDVLRAQFLRHDAGVPYAEGVASVVVDRLCDLYVLAAFVAVGGVRYASVLTGSLAWITWAGVAATVVGPLLLFVPGRGEALLGGLFAKLSPDRGAAGMARFLAAVRANVGRPLAITMPLTVATFVVNYAQGWLIAHAMGLPLSVFDATCLLAIASLLGLLPISVSGVGVRELFFSLAFPMLGFAPAEGVTFGILVFVCLYLIVAAAGFVSWQIAPPPSASLTPSGPED